MIDLINCKVNNQIYFLTLYKEADIRITGVSLTNSETPAIIFTISGETVTLVSSTLSAQRTQLITDFIPKFIRPSIIQYLPSILQYFLEFQEICSTEDELFNLTDPYLDVLFSESTITYCDEARLAEWERELRITPEGTVEQRKLFMIATLRGQGKLSEVKIQSIVNAFTGGTCTVALTNSAIVVTVLPPNNGEIYLFPDVERVLSQLIPAHLGLSVVRFYSTWGDISTDFASWNAVKSLASWSTLKNYI